MKTSINHPVFESFDFKFMELKNRVAVAPMSRVSAGTDGVSGKQMADYYSRYAKGGFGLIITEGVYTDDHGSKAYPRQPGIVNEKQKEAWTIIADDVKSHGAAIICQLMHAGALSQALDKTIAPSSVKPLGVKLAGYGGEGEFSIPSAMTEEEIRLAVHGFVAAAANAVDAGFHGVEIHGANGYLIDQFLTDYTNLRTDSYGGSVENQLRIVNDIIVGIRKTAPSGFMVGLRLSEGKVNNLGYRWPEGAERARRLLGALKHIGPDYVHIASEGGTWDKSCVYEDGSSFTQLAREIVQVPVIANGGLHNLALSRYVLGEGHGDLVSVGQAVLSDPDWLTKVEKGTVPANAEFGQSLLSH